MNSFQVKCFMTVVEENNFTKAADRLYVTQPAVSKTIQNLEEELGCELFTRYKSKKIKITEEGQLYYELFLHFAAEFDQVQRRVGGLKKDNSKILEFAYSPRWNVSDFLPETIKKMKLKNPDVIFKVECLELEQIRDDLLNNKLDMALTFLDQFEKSDLSNINYCPVCNINTVILYSDSYIKRHGPVNSPKDFSNSIFYLNETERNRNTSLLLYEYCKPYGFVPHIQYLRNWYSVLAMVETGDGVAIFDEWTQYLRMENLHYFKLKGQHTVALGWQKYVSRDVADTMVEYLQNELFHNND